MLKKQRKCDSVTEHVIERRLYFCALLFLMRNDRCGHDTESWVEAGRGWLSMMLVGLALRLVGTSRRCLAVHGHCCKLIRSEFHHGMLSQVLQPRGKSGMKEVFSVFISVSSLCFKGLLAPAAHTEVNFLPKRAGVNVVLFAI